MKSFFVAVALICLTLLVWCSTISGVCKNGRLYEQQYGKETQVFDHGKSVPCRDKE